jgi:hypothetical protein
MEFARWMAEWPGRILRIVAGLILIYLGLRVVDGTWGTLLAIIGIVPILAGVLNVCLIAPLLRAPFRGRDVLQR